MKYFQLNHTNTFASNTDGFIPKKILLTNIKCTEAQMRHCFGNITNFHSWGHYRLARNSEKTHVLSTHSTNPINTLPIPQISFECYILNLQH